MKRINFKDKNIDELKNTVSELRGKLFNLSFQSPDQKQKDTSQAGKLRKDIARALTIIKQRKNGTEI